MSDALERPERPMLPPLLWALLAALCCMRAVLWDGPSPWLTCAAAGVAVTVGTLVSLAAHALRRGEALMLVLPVAAALACSLLSCSFELMRQSSLERSLESSPVSSWEFLLEGDMSKGASGWRGRASALWAGRVRGSVWLVSDEWYRMGTTLRIVGRFSPNEDGEWGASSRAQGLAGTVRAVSVLEQRPAGGLRGMVLDLRENTLERLDPVSSDARALLAGTVCGSTEAMAERGLSELFAACGISHLVAVSGGHLVLVTALAGWLLGHARLPVPLRAAALLVVTGAFVVFCGAPSSAVRSWAMCLVAELSRIASRRPHPLSSVCAVALVMALVSPGVTGQLGYVLSVVCVCGICALGGYARYVVRVCIPGVGVHGPGPLFAALRRVEKDAREALALTIVSQVVTLPLVCATFSQLSLVAPLANVLLTPLFSAILALGIMAASLPWLPLAQSAALMCCDVVGCLLMAIVHGLARLPLACVAVSVDEGTGLLVLGGLVCVLLVWWPRVSRRAVLGVLGAALVVAGAHVVRWRYCAPACVRVLDVGQGDAILITDGASSMLVDTGPGSDVVEALSRYNVFHLDAVLLTHLHADHAGGLSDVLGVVDVGAVVVPEGADTTMLGQDPPIDEMGYGDSLAVGDFTLTAVSPVEPVGGEGNEGSLVLVLEYSRGGRSLTGVLAADAERDEVGAAVERGDVGDIDFLKVGHHGSENSLTREIARALQPEVSVASAGEGNAYGHPDPVCVEVLEKAGSVFLCTKDVGDVTVEPGDSGPVVTCQREEGP